MNATPTEHEQVREVLRRCTCAEFDKSDVYPLEQRFSSFQPRRNGIASTSGLVRRGSALLRHLKVGSMNALVRQGEATRLFESSNENWGGFERAFRDAKAGQVGLVLKRLVDRVISDRRRDFIRGVLAAFIDPSDGAARLRLADALVAVSPEVTFLSSSQMPREDIANNLEQVLLTVANIRQQSNRMALS